MSKIVGTCALVDGKVWALAQSKKSDIDERDTVLLQYQYDVNENGDAIMESKNNISQTSKVGNEMTMRKERIASVDSGCSSQSDSCIEERRDGSRNTTTPTKKTPKALEIALRNAPEEQMRSFQSALGKNERMYISKVQKTIPVANVKPQRPTLREKVRQATKMWSNYVKEEDRNSRMIDRRLGNGFNDDIKEIEPTESEESSSETGELSDEVNVDVSDDVDTSSTAEDDDDGIIIKYKYFLSSRKDQHGNPIKWWKTNTAGSEGNQNQESVRVRSGKQDTNLKNANNESKEKTAQSGDREDANKDLVVLKYEYVKGDDVGRTRDVIKLPTSPSYEVKSTQTTIFSKKSIRTDEDLRQFIRRDNNAVQRNTDVAHKNTTDSYNAAKNKTNVSQNKTTDNCGAKFQNRTNVSQQHTNVSEQKTSVLSQRKSSVERSPSVGSPTRRSFSPPLSPRNKSPSYYHKEDVRTYVSNYVTPMKAKRPQVSTKKRKVKNNLTCVFAETPVQTRRISKCKEVNDEKRETKKNSNVSAKSDSKEKSPERIIFKANLGSLPYQGVFRLDDDIRYLKTFIHVISGIPPSRQSYFGDENDKKVAKRRKVRKLRELGFNGGDIIHLAVK